ncbi:MAG: hypothetical protein JKY96_04165 [Phycisphaerales bacterium]|nr:hypothetical protein [Phycisphaerales bacterium]
MGQKSRSNTNMTPFPTSILILVAIAGAVCVLAMLQVLACVMKHEVTLHDLRNRVERINNDYAVHLARQCGDIPADAQLKDPWYTKG